MLVPLSWLEEYIEIEETPEELAEVLTLAGLEVDSIKRTALGFEGVTACEVISTEPHPEADKLTIAQVSVGEEQFQVVCGAPNCRTGIKTAFAQVGAKLTSSDGNTFKIKKSKLRGVDSHGMLCAGDELGLAGEDGILELDKELPLGLSLAELYGDVVLEISLTPNLGHCMSVRGIAREISSLTGRPMKDPKVILGTSSEKRTSEMVNVSVENDSCWRYCALAVEGITVGPSPEWLRKKLEAAGLASINNVVDVTNYVMMSWGQPLHAFDADTLSGNELVVRSLKEPVNMETLDGVMREIFPGTLLICDAEKPVAIAGVMGGQNSAISETTNHVILEGAWFCPSAVRRSSKLLGLRSDSSSRFERGVDGSAVLDAVRYAGELLFEIACGKVCAEPIDESVKSVDARVIPLRLFSVNRLLGTTLSLGELEEIIQKMSTPFTLDDKTFNISVPAWRNDIHEEIDLIEEVARVYGYNNIDFGIPKVVNSNLANDPLFEMERHLRELFVQEGMQELLCCDLINPDMARIGSPDDFLAHVLKPSSIDQSVLRPSLLPGLLDVMKRNIDHSSPNLLGFEIGKIHYKDEDQFVEKPMAGLLMSGMIQETSWNDKGSEGDFYDLKGIIERVFTMLASPRRVYERAEIDLFHPGRQATITAGRAPLGFIGEVHPDTLDKWGIEKRVYYAHVEINTLLKMGIPEKTMQPLPLYPGSERDWTVTMKKESPALDLMQAIREVPSRLLKKTSLLDVYESEKLGEGQKNITVRFTYRDEKKTIAFETVEREHARILKMLETKLQ
jgi:phenylalanyl-tRNA synthetase beta chain